jgi:hypothetical protein
MHAENWYAAAPGPPFAAAAAPDEVPDDGELPPQPAATSATATTPRSAGAERREDREKMDGVGVITGIL